MTALTILILEDEPLIRMDLEMVAEDAGWTPWPAGHLETAMKLLDAGAPDTAILDLNLGNGVTSRAVAERLHAAGIPFVILTGDHHTDMSWLQTMGAPILRKPHMANDVIRIVAGLAEQARLRRA